VIHNRLGLSEAKPGNASDRNACPDFAALDPDYALTSAEME